MFSLPRNMMERAVPRGDARCTTSSRTGSATPTTPTPATGCSNAVYSQCARALPCTSWAKSENEGATPSSRHVAGSLGTHVDYYVLINLGFQQKKSTRSAQSRWSTSTSRSRSTATDAGIPPTGYLEPGPTRLNGFHALVLARGLSTTSGCCVSATRSTPSSRQPTPDRPAALPGPCVRRQADHAHRHPRELMPRSSTCAVPLVIDEVDGVRVLRTSSTRRPGLHRAGVGGRQGARPAQEGLRP